MAGCGNDMSDLETYVAEVKSRKSSAIEPLPEPVEYDPPPYVGEAYRSPFSPVVAEIPDSAPNPQAAAYSGLQPTRDRQKEPLEYFPLDGLRMVGTIDAGSKRWALIRTAEPQVYRVQVGNYAGLNHGRIVEIADDEVTLIELVRSGSGEWNERRVSIAVTEQDSNG